MSTEIELPKVTETTNMELNPLDGAMVFRTNGVELFLPELPEGAALPDHLTILIAFAAKLNDREFIAQAINSMYERVDQLQKGK